jgi:hypothetical protein
MTFESRKALGINSVPVPLPIDRSSARPLGEFDKRPARLFGAVIGFRHGREVIPDKLGDSRSPFGREAARPVQQILVDPEGQVFHAHIICAAVGFSQG